MIAAAFIAPIIDAPGVAILPAPDATTTIAPLRRAIVAGAMAGNSWHASQMAGYRRGVVIGININK
jgi:hypothetical protein